MRTHTPFYAAAILALAYLIAACGDIADEHKFPCGAPEASRLLSHFEEEAEAYRASHGLSAHWKVWVVDRKERYADAYVRARTNPHVQVLVAYETHVPYSPSWTNEEEHMAALRHLVEQEYTGWSFTFATSMENPEITAVLGATRGASEYVAREEAVYLIYETIFSHEFAHSLGIAHHYCNGPEDTCGELPPDEGPCIMSRNGYGWGHSERFVLNLAGAPDTDAIHEVIKEISHRYPPR